ncbi:unnamed protein product [Paramecium sonneborni]|uniref:Uncharacterized protein n=1 Tax=Paramecium sonneborni TaxID=65129 RepID=A0A8S1R2U7_9CILI|nr:unnamed protein product [Paramecium sonneborni]
MNSLLDNLSKQHKNLKLFKQIIKRESKALRQFLNETIQIQRQFNFLLFDGIHYHLSKLQSDLQNQYVLLKQLGKQFQEVKQDAQICFKNKLNFNNRESDQTNVETDIETKKRQDYQAILTNDMIKKEKQMIKKTNQIIQIFEQKHDFVINSCATQSNSDCVLNSQKMRYYMKPKAQAVIISNQTVESITISSQVDERESFQEYDSSFEKQLQKERQLHQFLNNQLTKKQF